MSNFSKWWLSLFFAVSAFTQVDTGSISGFVKDQSGGAVQNASVLIDNPASATSIHVSTRSDGFYSAPDLKPGIYQVEVSSKGFQRITKTGVEVRVQDRLSVDFELRVGQITESVSVRAVAPILENDSSSLGQLVASNQIENTPLNGRNYIQLATLGAGTSPSERTSERNTFVANGARPIQNSYLLDGIDNKNKIVGFDNSPAQSIEPVIDAIEEFKVQTSTFSAEFGQSAGAVVNATIKSGTDRFRGSLFEYLRNSFFDADPYFQPAQTAKPQFIQNQFGATLGGPIVKQHTFFFFAWQSSRTLDRAPQLATVPRLAQVAGQFSVPIYDPATTTANPNGSGYIRSPFAGNYIPATRFDPVAAKLLLLFPAPNLGGKNNFFSNQTESVSNDQFIGRLDHRFSDRDSLFGRYLTTGNTNILPAPLPPPASEPSIVNPEAHSIAVSETHVFTPSLFNEVRAGYQETREVQNIDAPRLFDQYGILGAPDLSNVAGLPVFSVAGLNSIGTTGPGTLQTPATGSGNLPVDKQGQVIQAYENLSWVRGRHTLKFGFDFQQVTLYANSTLNARPTYSFSGVYTQNPQNRSTTGAAFADFLLGDTSSSVVSTRSVSTSRQHIYEGYVQDDWKVNGRLTVNAGLRYEVPLPFYELQNDYSDVILEPGPLYGSLLNASAAAQYGYRNSFTNPNLHNFAPRLGFAYQLTPKTVIRAAGGIFYGRDENVPVARRPTNNPPYFIQTSYTSDQIDPSIVLSQGFPSNALNPATVITPAVNSYLKNSPTPYVQQWNFNIQRELASGLLAQLAYVGSSSHDLYYPDQIDQPTPGPGSIQARRPFPQYSALYEYAPFVSSNYESLQAQVERRLRSGLSLLAAYTYSHSIDNGPSQTDNVVAPQNALDFAAERGDSNFDIRHRVVVSALFELPFGAGKRYLSSPGPWKNIFGGWKLSGIFSAQTGLPFTPVLSYDPTNTGITSARPNRLASGALPANLQSVNDWFNQAAFIAPPAYTYGNSGRDILSGPGFRNLDLSLARQISIAERARLELRAEAFNLFNTPELGLPNATLGQSTTGVISTVVNPQRELQFALRLAF